MEELEKEVLQENEPLNQDEKQEETYKEMCLTSGM